MKLLMIALIASAALALTVAACISVSWVTPIASLTRTATPSLTVTQADETPTHTARIELVGKLAYDTSCYCYKIEIAADPSNVIPLRFASADLMDLASTYMGHRVEVSGYWSSEADMTMFHVESISATTTTTTLVGAMPSTVASMCKG